MPYDFTESIASELLKISDRTASISHELHELKTAIGGVAFFLAMIMFGIFALVGVQCGK